MVKTQAEFGRIDKLIIHVNNRIVQKFKGFREAFRRFDKNFDGTLNFREFTEGMYEMGLNLTLPDFRVLFEAIDFDNEGQIDFFKFCLLNYDKAELRDKLKRGTPTDPNYLNKRTMDMLMPDPIVKKTQEVKQIQKNKDEVAFNRTIQLRMPSREYLDKKLIIKANFQGLK